MYCDLWPDVLNGWSLLRKYSPIVWFQKTHLLLFTVSVFLNQTLVDPFPWNSTTQDTLWLSFKISDAFLRGMFLLKWRMSNRYQAPTFLSKKCITFFYCQVVKWYFVSKNVLTYCETKLFFFFIEKNLCNSGNALARVQRVHEPADLWDITFCTHWSLGF
jgi:hypothetical protein